MSRVNKEIYLNKRAVTIVDLIRGGETAARVGVLFSISRERVCQIYFKKTGQALREYRSEKRAELVSSVVHGFCNRCKDILDHGTRKLCKPCRDEFNKEYKCLRNEAIRRFSREISKDLYRELNRKYESK